MESFKLSNWAATEIVVTEDAKERVKVLGRWIDIADVSTSSFLCTQLNVLRNAAV
jgi:hypothetical protein